MQAIFFFSDCKVRPICRGMSKNRYRYFKKIFLSW